MCVLHMLFMLDIFSASPEQEKRNVENLNYSWDILMCWMEASVTTGFRSLKILLCFNAVAENNFFVLVFYLCQEERDVQRASSCGRQCSCSLRQTAGICLWRWCHWEPRWLCWCCLHYKLWWPVKEAEMKNIHLLVGASFVFMSTQHHDPQNEAT